MNTIIKSMLILLSTLIISCGDSIKESKGILGDKKAQLEKLKTDLSKTAAEIKKLEDEIILLDTAGGKQQKVKLVSVAPAITEDFSHYIDLQGKVDAENISYVSPGGMPGVVKAIFIKAGQFVKKGQLLLKLDDAIARQQITAAEKGVEGIKIQLAFAKNIYARQKNLWEQNIGSEVQLISAKNSVDALENSLASANENVKIVKEQLKTTLVYADVSGIADIVDINVGETFTGAGARGPQIQIVNNSTLKVVTEVPENYMSRVQVGSAIVINLPDANKTFNSTVKRASQIINSNTRTFTVEAAIPGGSVRPNSIASVRIKDYNAPNAIVIPVNLVQTDDKGKYVYVVEQDSKQRNVVVKKPVVVGESYNDKIEIKGGLQAGAQLIVTGYQSVYDKQVVAVE